MTIEDLRTLALRRTPRAVFDYVDGAAEAEISLRRARRAFESVEFRPRVLRNVSEVALTTTVLGSPVSTPVILAPTGFTRMMHHEGELAVARAAQRHGAIYTLSTMGTTSIERVAGEAPAARRWFQLYVWRDRSTAVELMTRARDAGYEALMVTVDVPVAGARLRDVRNGLTVPPSLTPRTLLDMGRHPRWWLNLLTTDPLEFASLSHWRGTPADLVNSLFDPAMTTADLEWARRNWDGPLIVKGIQSLHDARTMLSVGVDAMVISNHGGRQLDRAPVPLRLLPAVRDEIGDRCSIFVDSGVMNGGDVIAALALGADAVLVGRAYLYGLMAGGEAGVHRALDILQGEMGRTLALLGVPRLSDLGRQQVALPADVFGAHPADRAET